MAASIAHRPGSWDNALATTYISAATYPVKRLDRYIALNIAKGYFLVSLVLTSAFGLLDLVKELDDTDKGQYQAADAFMYVAMTLPGRMFDMLPLIAMIGSVTALGTMAAANELVAIRAAGVSTSRISWAAIKAGIALMVLAALAAEFILPPLAQRAYTQRTLAIAGSTAVSTEGGFWFRNERQFVNVRKMLYGRIPAGIDIYTFDGKGNLTTFTHAAQGTIREQFWLLQDVVQKQLPGETIATEQMDKLAWRPFPSSAEINALVMPLEALSPSVLHAYAQRLQSQGQDAARYELAFWHKVCLPLAAGTMVLLATTFVFGPHRSLSSGRRLLVGVGIGMLFYLANQIISYIGLLANLPAALTALTPVLLALAVSMGLMRRLQD